MIVGPEFNDGSTCSPCGEIVALPGPAGIEVAHQVPAVGTEPVQHIEGVGSHRADFVDVAVESACQSRAARFSTGMMVSSMNRPKLTTADRVLWFWWSAAWVGWQPSFVIIKPVTVIGWHRKGFGLFWTWKMCRGRLGRPAVPADV